MKPLRLSPTASVTLTSAGAVLRSSLGAFQLTGADLDAFVTRMVPLLDGSRDREAVQAALSGHGSPASVARFLDLLIARGLIEEGQALDRLASARVILAGPEPWGEAAAAALGASGVGAIDRLGEGAVDAERSLVLAAVSPDDDAEVDRVARLAHRAGVRSLWAHVDGSRLVLGPFTVPGRTACRICAGAEPLNPAIRARPSPGGRAPILARLLAGRVALEVIKVVSTGGPPRLSGRVLIEDLATFESTLHTLVRVPWCSVCGTG
jgi:hypothetical protein